VHQPYSLNSKTILTLTGKNNKPTITMEEHSQTVFLGCLQSAIKRVILKKQPEDTIENNQ
jgi:hypothetical protein